MEERLLNLPKLLFIIGTRVALGAGVALLATRHLSEEARFRTGATLALFGVATTIPAARLLLHAKSSRQLRAA